MKYTYVVTSRESHSIPLLSENRSSISHIFVKPEQSITLSYPGLDSYVPHIFSKTTDTEGALVKEPTVVIKTPEPVVVVVPEPATVIVPETVVVTPEPKPEVVSEPVVKKEAPVIKSFGNKKNK